MNESLSTTRDTASTCVSETLQYVGRYIQSASQCESHVTAMLCLKLHWHSTPTAQVASVIISVGR